MIAGVQPRALPSSLEGRKTFRFVSHELSSDGEIELRYGFDDALEFVERITIPVEAPITDEQRAQVSGLVALLHLTAGVSYFKLAAPPEVATEAWTPTPAAAALLEALYSEGLGEFAYENRDRLPGGLPRPVFAAAPAPAREAIATGDRGVLVPVGGGKDSVVAIEIMRASGRPWGLFSVKNAAPIERTAEIAGGARHIAGRVIDPQVGPLNREGALNGHVPVTAIVSLIALITAVLNGYSAVAMANERSASQGNVRWDGIDVNHQFSKSLRAERLLQASLAEVAPGLGYFSILRGASELAIARAFSRFPQYHHAFTSCNAVFRLDPELRLQSWCRDCPKCRFVYLALAPFNDPEHLTSVFGADLLDDPAQTSGFALLTATGGHKPFECVGEEEESIAALRLIAEDPRWEEHAVVQQLATDVLGTVPPGTGDPATVFALSTEHEIPAELRPAADELLGA
ncbi:MAG: hypothetical protein Q7T55_25810 [Solirubrobacteraceae bacterium]|nr:hypothetical protein [Solirubrobacteraceae bacterium]